MSVRIFVYAAPEGEGLPCPPPPDRDVKGRVKLDEPFKYGEEGTATIAEFTVEPGSHIVFAKQSLAPGECTWEPALGQKDVTAGQAITNVCFPYRCIKARNAAPALTGPYGAKRVDQSTAFSVNLTFRENAEHCLTCEIQAPGQIDHAEAFLHMKTETGRHGGRPHRGDFMNADAPLTAGFLQGTFRGPRGEEGSLRMIMAMLPSPQPGLVFPYFGGFLTFAGGPQNVEVTFRKTQPVQWGSFQIPIYA